jgi:hypothetical protein
MSTASVPNTDIAKDFLGTIDAYDHGQNLRKQLGPEASQLLANALFSDGHNNSLEVQAQARSIHESYSNSWGFVAGGLDPDNRHPDGSRRQGC